MDAVLYKVAARGREVQEKREAEQRRALLVLVLRHLTDHGYIDAAERLRSEANVSLARQDAADNVSLLHILQDYEEAQEQRYGRRPKLVKQLTCEVRFPTEAAAADACPEVWGQTLCHMHPAQVPTGGGGSRQVSRQSSQHQNALGYARPLRPTHTAAGHACERTAAQQQQPAPAC